MDNRRNRRKRVRRFIAYTLVILTAIICTLVVWGVYLFKHDPAYWTANQRYLEQTSTQEIDRVAMEAEIMVYNLLSTIRADGKGDGKGNTTSSTSADNKTDDVIQSTINLTSEQMNAWLDRRLPAWAANRNIQLPSEISHLMVHPENGRLAIAFELSKGDYQKVITLVVNITMVGSGRAMFHLTHVRAGSLTSPVNPSKLAKLLNDEELKHLINEMVQGKVIDMTFKHPIDSSKTVTIQKLGIHGNGVIADIQTK